MDLTVELTDIGEGISSGLVTAILPQVDENIAAGDTLIEIETDKAVVPFPSPQTGVLKQILIAEGTEIKVGDKIATLHVEAAATSPVAPEKTPPPPATAATPPVAPEKTPPPPATAATPPVAPEKTPPPTPHTTLLAASPATRKLARELAVTLTVVQGSGRKGRITMEDLKAHVKSSMTARQSSPTPIASTPLPNFSAWGEVTVEKVSRLRQTIAQNMQRAWTTIPHVHHHAKADLTVISKWQSAYHSQFKEQGSTLSITPILIKALGHVLREFPIFNASFAADTHEIHYKKYYNVGVAVDTEAGLIVPVIKNVARLTVFEIGTMLRAMAQKTRERKVDLNDLKGACITLSNLGGIGGEHFTPIINPPEVAIVGVARTVHEVRLNERNRPYSVPLLPLTLGYDHRVIDGAVAARFLVRLKNLLETPETLLMGLTLSN